MNLSSYAFPNTSGDTMTVVAETEAVAKEREAALLRIKERKRKAKKKQEARQQAEREREQEQNNDIGSELEELRSTVSAQNTEQTEKKMNRLRKKFERRIQAAENEKMDLIEVFTFTFYFLLRRLLTYFDSS